MTTGDHQEPEEIRAQAADGSAADFVLDWLQAVGDNGSWEWVMMRSTEELRHRHADFWVDQALTTGQVDRSAESLARNALAWLAVMSPWWRDFADANLRFMRQLIDYPETVPGIGLRPRPVGVDSELVAIVDYGGMAADENSLVDGVVGKYAQTTSTRPLAFLRLVHRDGQWLVDDYPPTSAG